MSCGERAGQFRLTRARPLRRLAACRQRATSSLPVPLSPVISTVSSVGAAWAIRCRSSRIAGLWPTMIACHAGAAGGTLERRPTFSPCRRARATSDSSCSTSNGFSM